jgi:Brp/Blh family beta-carotene 15,15'-monooxygenase
MSLSLQRQGGLITIDTLIANLGLINLLALSAVGVIGLPHGAFDSAIAAHLGYIRRPRFLIRFLLLYTLITALIVAVWLIFPVVSLIVFLLISIIHFGLGDARADYGWLRWVQVVAHGGIVVVGISQFHKSEVNIIFSYLIGHNVTMVWATIDIVSIIIVAAFVIYAWQALWNLRWRHGFIELISLLLIFSILPPLIGFAFYFCCIHSLRHLLVLWRTLQTVLQRNNVYLQAFIYTITSWIVGGIVFWWCTNQMLVEAALIRVIFIGLAALTVPHMLLVDGFFRRHLGGS